MPDLRRRDRLRPMVRGEAAGDCPNPGRGWYRIYTFRLGEPDEEGLRWLPFEPGERLALIRLDICGLGADDFNKERLSYLERIFERFRTEEKDIILRILYDTEGRGMEREPSSLREVLAHMRALGPVVEKYADAIFLCQGLFVGNWGEMHGSKFLAPAQIRELAATWQEATGGSVRLALRRPCFCRMVSPQGEEPAKTGLYDDAIFGSKSHLGTFGEKPGETAGWEEAWRPEDELLYLKHSLTMVPCGGEALWQEAVGADERNGRSKKEAEETVRLLKSMGVTYLNCIHDVRLLSRWKTLTWQGGESLYDYIGSHLGYRIFVRGVSAGRGGRLRIFLENTGFAPMYDEAELKLTIEDAKGQRKTRGVAFDVCGLSGGASAKLDVAVRELSEPGIRVFLSMLRKKDGRPIRFANEGAEDLLLLAETAAGKKTGREAEDE